MIILHGENDVLSYNALMALRERSRGTEIITFEGAKITLTDLLQSLESQSLFGDQRTVIVENLISSRGSKDAILTYLKSSQDTDSLILYEKKKVDKRILAKFPRAKIQEFTTPSHLFSFLEGLMVRPRAQSVEAFRQVVEEESAEMVFVMLCRQLRLLYLLSVDEAGSLPFWQVKKLKTQLTHTTSQKLKKGLTDLLLIEYSQRTGKSSFDLRSALELFILGL